jgi:L-fucose dehydrogenase
MNINLEGKVVLVSGGASGIGEAIVREAILERAIPVIVNKASPKVLEFERELKDSGNECLFIEAELSKKEDCRKAVDHTIKAYGKIDVLVNNAGVNDRVGLEQGSPEDFMLSIQMNLYHYYTLTLFALQALIASKGSIVNISSVTATGGQGGTSGYTASKGGQLALTREWAVELLKYGIRVNAILPAHVRTPLYDSWIQTFDHPEEKLNNIVKRIPLDNRMTTPQEIAYMTLFLASDKASHITGQHLFVDGGYTHLDRAIGR